jgi:hypothetical protein
MGMSSEEEESPPAIVWPDVQRLAFGPGVRSHPRTTANLDWSFLSGNERMFGYVEGYRRAAQAVFSLLDGGLNSPDYVLWPLAFMWRHHLELAMKDIIARGREIQGDEWGFPEHHDLVKLWHEAKPHIVECGPESSPELDNVEAGLVEFQTIDPYADGFRYPVGKRLQRRSLAKAPEQVNLHLLQEAMESIANFFSAVQSQQEVFLDHIRSTAESLG